MSEITFKPENKYNFYEICKLVVDRKSYLMIRPLNKKSHMAGEVWYYEIAENEKFIDKMINYSENEELIDKPRKNRGFVLIDLFSASAVTQVYEALNETNKNKLLTIFFGRVVEICFSFCK